MKDFFVDADYSNLTDYMRNVKSLVLCGYARMKDFGYLAYAPVAYKQMKEKQDREKSRKDAAANSQYIGNVGDRVTIAVKDTKLVTSWETVYGFTYLYKFTTADNNVIVWYASKTIGNNPKQITGTIKDHKDYDGEKQTILTRCKVM